MAVHAAYRIGHAALLREPCRFTLEPPVQRAEQSSDGEEEHQNDLPPTQRIIEHDTIIQTKTDAYDKAEKTYYLLPKTDRVLDSGN